MPKMHDPDLILARSRLECALAFFKKAQQDIYKTGATERGTWEGCLTELEGARTMVMTRVKRRA